MCSVLVIFYGYTRESLSDVCAYGISCVMREKLLYQTLLVHIHDRANW